MHSPPTYPCRHWHTPVNNHRHISTCPDHRDTCTHMLVSTYMQTLMSKHKDTQAPRQADSCAWAHVCTHAYANCIHTLYTATRAREGIHMLTHLLALMNTYTGSQRAPSVLKTMVYLPHTLNTRWWPCRKTEFARSNIPEGSPFPLSLLFTKQLLLHVRRGTGVARARGSAIGAPRPGGRRLSHPTPSFCPYSGPAGGSIYHSLA